MSDIDILVSKEDLVRARNLLIHDGYYQTVILGRNRWQFELLENNRFREGRSAFVHPSRMPIDLHTALNYGLGPRRVSLDVGAFWKSAVALDSYCFLPDPLYNFSHLVVHALEWGIPSTTQFLDCARVFKLVKPQWQGHGFTHADFQEFKKHIDPFIRSLDDAISTGRLNSIGKKLLRKRNHPAQIILMYRRGDLSNLKAAALYLVGYFFPNPDYYRGYTVPQAWWAHWANLLITPFRKAHANAPDTSHSEAQTPQRRSAR